MSLALFALFTLFQTIRRIYYDYYFYARVKDEYIAPQSRQRILDTAALTVLLIALYFAYRLLRYSLRHRRHDASHR